MTELNATSSIGAQWPPQPSTQNRIRGFATERVLSTPDDADWFAEQFTAAESQLSLDGPSRLSIRAVAEPQTMRMLAERGVPLEAALRLCTPVYGSGRSDQLVIYAGRNMDHRRAHIDPAIDLASDGPESLIWRPRLEMREQQIADRLHAQLYTGEIHAGTDDTERSRLIDEFCDLYEPFGYNRAEVEELLTNPANHIVYVRSHDGQILSTALAETARIEVDGLGELVMAEITEASTRPEYRGQGLYRLASGLLISRLADISHQAISRGEAPINAIYGESNMNMPGVLQAALKNGRRFSAADAASFGMLFNPHVRRELGLAQFGVLEQNFRVEDGVVAPGMYNDFALSYVTQAVMGALLMYPRGRHAEFADARTA